MRFALENANRVTVLDQSVRWQITRLYGASQLGNVINGCVELALPCNLSRFIGQGIDDIQIPNERRVCFVTGVAMKRDIVHVIRSGVMPDKVLMEAQVLERLLRLRCSQRLHRTNVMKGVAVICAQMSYHRSIEQNGKH